jgi:hypothetical protein
VKVIGETIVAEHGLKHKRVKLDKASALLILNGVNYFDYRPLLSLEVFSRHPYINIKINNKHLHLYRAKVADMI